MQGDRHLAGRPIRCARGRFISAVVCVVAAAVLGALLCSCQHRSGTGHTTGVEASPLGPPQDQILFVSRREGDRAIYLMNAEGTNQTRLTRSRREEWNPAWSPDGTKIAFLSNRDVYGHPEASMEPEHQWEVEPSEIYVMNADGSEQKRVTKMEGHKGEPAWSPDGTKIAFDASPGTFLADTAIYLMNVDGGGLKRLTQSPLGRFEVNVYSPQGASVAWIEENRDPVWSPDGNRIAFVSGHGEGVEIYGMSADGSNATNLTQSRGGDWEPQWSPDGSKIAFSSERAHTWRRTAGEAGGIVWASLDGEECADTSPILGSAAPQPQFAAYVSTYPDVFVMNADGSAPTALTRTNGEAWGPVWSPDGKQIAFNRNTAGLFTPQICVMNADGTGQRVVTSAPGHAAGPVWSPDGARLAFMREVGMDRDVWVMNADGSDPTNLTNSPKSDSDPQWRPRARGKAGASAGQE